MKQIANIPNTENQRVVIIGGGFAGIKLAMELKNSKYQIVLIDKRNYHQFQPLLYQVATAGLEPTAISFPVRKLFQDHKNLVFRIGSLVGVNTDKKQIYTSIGKLNYNYLVIATGARTNFFNMENIKKYALPLKSPSDAILIRNVILENYEEALNHTSSNCINAYLNIAIVGGGPTGVELAGALAEMKKFVLPKDYPDLDFSKMRIFLFESGSSLLKTMSDKSSNKAKKYLEGLGVEVRINTSVSDYDGKIVKLSNGETHMTHTLVWAAGIKMEKIEGFSPETYGRSNDLFVDEYNRIIGYFDIFAIGDVSTFNSEKYPQGYPKVVQTAIQQANILSKNFKNIQVGEILQKFQYKNKGSMVTIGRNLAVADLPKFHLSGFIAWVIWSFVHLFSIIGLKNKIITFIGWSWNYFSYNQSLRLLIKQNERQHDERVVIDECKFHDEQSPEHISSMIV